jgi:hypothetical protein
MPTFRSLAACSGILCAWALLGLATPASAAESSSYRGKLGVNVNAIDTSTSQPGWLAEVQYTRFVTASPIFYGVEGGYGMPIATSGNQLISGGVIGGVEHITSWGFLIGASLSLDAGQATQNSYVVGGTIVAVIKPQAYLGFGVGGGFRFALTAGYLLVSNVSAYSAPMVGLRVDFKSETVIKPVDDR